MNRLRAAAGSLFTIRGMLLRWVIALAAFGLLPVAAPVRFAILGAAVIILAAACWRAARAVRKEKDR